MATAKQRQYAAAMNRVIKRFETMEEATVKQMIAYLEQYRRDIIGYMSSVPDDTYYASFALGELKANIENQTETLRRQLVTMQNGALQTAVTDGVEMVVEPLIAAGIEGAFFRSSVAQINVLMDYSADLIKGLTNDVIKLISSEIGRVGLGALTPFQAMQKVTDILGVQGGRKIVGGIAARAETIVRTETNRAFSVATYSQQQVSKQEFPELQKAWMATGDNRTRPAHLNAHGQTVDVDKPFVVGGEEMMHPLDPAASAKNTVHCRCRSYAVHPEIGTIPTPLDDQIEAEKERRGIEQPTTGKLPNFRSLDELKTWAIENGLVEGVPFGIPEAMRQKYIDNVLINLDGVPLDVAQEFTHQFYRMQQKHGLSALTSIKNVTNVPAAAAFSWDMASGTGALQINASFIESLKRDGMSLGEWMAKAGRDGYLVGDSVADLAYHESVHYYHRISKSSAINNGVDKLYNIAREQGLAANLSRYAEKNSTEFFAELATHVSKNGIDAWSNMGEFYDVLKGIAP